MTGQVLYNIHRGAAIDLGIAVLPTWEELSWTEQAFWEQEADGQIERDCGFDCV